ncbi:uncharacterized protein isoform X2 [Musca autumnalis]|uniref:uncharacterized protein isoform X2 n=1 Tax=Musca autumnalis TaxID=221902 RepID=UPI003CF116E2
MSERRDRCSSLDRALHEKAKSSPHGNGRYIPGRSPNRSPTGHHQRLSPHHVPSSPELFRYMPSPGTVVHTPTYALGRYQVHPQEIPARPPEEHHYDYHGQFDEQLAKTPLREPKLTTPRVRRRIEDLPEELLEQYEEPSFYEPPESNSFDELMCVFPTPVSTRTRTPIAHDREEKSPVIEKVAEETPKREVKPKLVKKGKTKTKECPPQHPPDYIDPEDAAAILRARQIAGLKTRNPKLLPKRSTPIKSIEAEGRRMPSSPREPSSGATYETILKRMAAIRAAAEAKRPPQIPVDTLTPTLMPTSVQDQLAEFETLERLYEAQPSQCPRESMDVGQSLVQRIENLQRQLLESPPPQKAPPSPVFEVPPIIRYYDLLKRQEALRQPEHRQEEYEHVPEYEEGYLKEIQDMADWELAELSQQSLSPQEIAQSSGTVCATPKRKDVYTPLASATPRVPQYLLSPNLLADMDYGQDQELSLSDISMPDDVCLQESSIEEPAVEDISAPQLDDLSISVPEALQPDYSLELSAEEQDKASPGFLTSMVGAVVDKFRNMFVGSGKDQEEVQIDEDPINLDSSLPNVFECTPQPPPKAITPPKPKTEKEACSVKAVAAPPSPESPIVIPTDPIHPKDYKAMVKRAQLIYKLKAREAAKAAQQMAEEAKKEPKKKPPVKTSIPKKAAGPKQPAGKKKPATSEPPEKIYPPGEYSPGYVEAVARARILAGYKNRSALLNPQRAARLAALKAQQEAERAAEEALPPVEKMKKRIARIREKRGKLPALRPSIDTLAALEAIRESLPRPVISQTPRQGKWKPAARKLKTQDGELFSKQYQRALEQIQPMSPIKEESFHKEDLIKFSPLRPHEMRLRLEHLKQQAEQKAAPKIIPKTITEEVEETEEELPSFVYTPLTLQSPDKPRTKEIHKESFATRRNDQSGLEERIHEQVLETSFVENGELHTTTKKITTKTDAFGKVTGRLEENVENIDAIGAPEFLDLSDTVQPSTAPRSPVGDLSIPTPSELIENIRQKVQQQLQMTRESPKMIPPRMESPPKKISMRMQSPKKIPLPTNLPDEQLFDVDMPEMDIFSPEKERPTKLDVSLPHLFMEEVQPSPKPAIPSSPAKPQKPICPKSPAKETKVPPPKKETIVIPPYPKDPKDYVAMVKMSRAIYQLQKQKEAEAAEMAAKQPPPPVVPKKKISKKPKGKGVPKKKEIPPEEYPLEPPPLPSDYVAAVARARQIAGLKNTTALLNPELAAKLAAEEAARQAELAEFEKLSAFGKIQKRMEKIRKSTEGRRKLQPSADVLGMIEAIRANLPIAEEAEEEEEEEDGVVEEEPQVLEGKIVCPSRAQDELEASLKSPQRHGTDSLKINKPICPRDTSRREVEDLGKHMAVVQPKDTSLDEFEALERQMAACPSGRYPKDTSLDEFEALERQLAAEHAKDTSLDEFEALERQMAAKEFTPKDTSLDEFEALERQLAAEHAKDTSLDEFEALERQMAACPREAFPHGKEFIPKDTSLDEFEALEKQLAAAHVKDTSLDEFEALERQMAAYPREMALHKILITPRHHKDATLDEFEALERQMAAKAPEKQLAAQAMTPPPFSRDTPKAIGYHKAKRRNIMAEIDREAAKEDPEFYQKLIGEFATHKDTQGKKIKPHEDLIVSTPLSAQERFRRIKEAQTQQIRPTEIKTPLMLQGTPIATFSPIPWANPDSPPPPSHPSMDETRDATAMKRMERDMPLVNLQSPPHQPFQFIKPFGQLEDMPLDDLAFEDVPTFANISFDKPLTPPPKPSELIARIKQQVEQRLREEKLDESIHLPLSKGIKLPENLPEEALLELSAPSFAQTPKSTTPQRVITPRHSLPYVFGEPPAEDPRKTPIKQELQPEPTSPKVAEMFPHNYPKEYVAMVKKAQAIYKLQQQQQKEAAAKGRLPLAKLPLKGRRKKLVLKKKPSEVKAAEPIDYPEELPPLPEDYVAAVAHARKLAGLKNKTAALNPEIRAKIAAQKAKAEAEAAAFEAMSEHDKLLHRMEKLKKKPGFKPTTKPTTEQMAFLQHMKEACPRPTPIETPIKPETREIHQGVTITPKVGQDQQQDILDEIAEFEKLEQMECPTRSPHMAPKPEELPMDLQEKITTIQQQQLATPLPPRERFQQLMAAKQATPQAPQTPQLSETPLVHYSPILLSTPDITTPGKRVKLSEKSTSQITKQGDDTIKEVITETQEMVNGELQQITEHITTASDLQGNITSQTKEIKKVIGFDTSVDAEALEAIDEPSFLDTTPISPSEVPPRPRDIIERIRKEVQSRPPRPEVPMGQLIELRTPPKILPLPQEVTEEDLLEMTLPELPKTPQKTPIKKKGKTTEPKLDISLPEMFRETPKQGRRGKSAQTQESVIRPQPLKTQAPETIKQQENYANLMAKIADMRKRGQLAEIKDIKVMEPLQAALGPRERTPAAESPASRLRKLKEWAAKTSTGGPPSGEFEESQTLGDISFRPLTLESPREKIAWKFDESKFKDLHDISALSDLQEPSFLQSSQRGVTLQATPSHLIENIRHQVMERLESENMKQAIRDATHDDNIGDTSMPAELYSSTAAQRRDKSEIDIGDISMPAELYSPTAAQRRDKSEIDIGDISMPLDMSRDARCELQSTRLQDISQPALGDISMPAELYSFSTPQRGAYRAERSLEIDIGDISMPADMSRDATMSSHGRPLHDISQPALGDTSMPSGLYSFVSPQRKAYLADKSEIDIGDISMPADMSRDARFQNISQPLLGDTSMPSGLYSFVSPQRKAYLAEKSEIDIGDISMPADMSRDARFQNISQPLLGNTSMPPELYSFVSPHRKAYLAEKSEIDIGDISMPADMSRDHRFQAERQRLHDISQPHLGDTSMPPGLYSFTSPQRSAYLPDRSAMDIGDISMPADMSREVGYQSQRRRLQDLSQPDLADISMPSELYSFGAAYLPDKSTVDIGDISMPADMSQGTTSRLQISRFHDISEPALGDISMPGELYSFTSPQRGAYLPHKSEINIGDISMPTDMSQRSRLQESWQPQLADISMPVELYSFSTPQRKAYLADKSEMAICDMTSEKQTRPYLPDISARAILDTSMPPELYSFSSPTRASYFQDTLDIDNISMPDEMSRTKAPRQCPLVQSISESAIGDITMPSGLYSFSASPQQAYLSRDTTLDHLEDISMPTDMSSDMERSRKEIRRRQLSMTPTQKEERGVAIKRTPLESAKQRMQMSLTPRSANDTIPEDSLAEFEALEKCERATPQSQMPRSLAQTRSPTSKKRQQITPAERISLTPRPTRTSMLQDSLAEFEALEKYGRESSLMASKTLGRSGKITSSARRLSATPVIPKVVPRSPVTQKQTPRGIKRPPRGQRLQMSATPATDSALETKTLKPLSEGTPLTAIQRRSPFPRRLQSPRNARMQMSITPRMASALTEDSMDLAEFEALERQERESPTMRPEMKKMQVSITPSACAMAQTSMASPDLAEFEALEKYAQGTPLARMALKQNLRKFKEKEQMQMSITPRTGYRIAEDSREAAELAEFEALESEGVPRPRNGTPRTIPHESMQSPTMSEFEALEKYAQATPLARMALEQNLRKIKEREQQIQITPRTIPEDSREAAELAEFEALEREGRPTLQTSKDYKRLQTSITPRHMTCEVADRSQESPTLAEFEALEKYAHGTPLARMALKQNLKKIKEMEQRQITMTPRTVGGIPNDTRESRELSEFEALEREGKRTPLTSKDYQRMQTSITPRMTCEVPDKSLESPTLAEFEALEKQAQGTPLALGQNLRPPLTSTDYQRMQTSITPRMTYEAPDQSQISPTLAEFEALERYAQGTPLARMALSQNLKKRMQMSITPRTVYRIPEDNTMESQELAEFEALEREEGGPTPLTNRQHKGMHTSITPRIICPVAGNSFNNTELREFEEYEKNAMQTPLPTKLSTKSKADLIRNLAKQRLQISITPRTACALSPKSAEDAEFEALEREAYGGTPISGNTLNVHGATHQRMHITPRIVACNKPENSMDSEEMAEFEALEREAMATSTTTGMNRSQQLNISKDEAIQNMTGYSAVRSLERQRDGQREQCER